MIATITLDPSEIFDISHGKDGSTILTLPAEVIRRVYCDIVATEVIAGRQRGVQRPKGEALQ